MVKVQKKVSYKHEEKTIKEVYDYLNEDLTNPKSYYEFYNFDTIKFVKPFMDIDIQDFNSIKLDNELLINDITNEIKKIFGDDSNVIYTTNHRNKIYKGKKKTKYYKKSYHFFISNKKINPITLNNVIRANINNFIKHIPEKYRKSKVVDMSIYGSGERKFRLPLTIKETELETQTTKKKKYMEMSEENTLENFSKYFVSLTDNLEEIKIEIKEEKKEEKKEEPVLTDDELNIKLTNMIGVLNNHRLNKVLEKYKLSKSKNNNKSIYYKHYSLDSSVECPFNKHDGTNRRYLVVDYLDNSIYMKCFSDKCKYKKQLILDNLFKELNEFNLGIFMKLNNYELQKKYLEKRVLYFSDLDKHKQIKYDRYDNIFLEDIKYLPIHNTINTFIDDEGEEKEYVFGGKYKRDRYRQVYKNSIFYPSLTIKNPDYYNEFRGFGYMKILPFYVNKDEVYKKNKNNLDFYLDFLKTYFCDNRDDVLDYFLSLLSFYLKYPDRLNHIILVLYSNQQGTGKSSFLDFMIKIIGKVYCSICEIEQVIDKHSNLSYKKIINVIEELEYSGKNNYAKALKNKCQAETTTLNEKCEPMRTIDNFVHYIETTNDIKSIPLPVSDRRHFPLEVKKIYYNDKLINKVDNLYNNDEFIYTFGRFLQEREEKFNFLFVLNWEKKRPKTDLFDLMIRRDTIDTFMIRLLTLKEIELDDNIDVLDDYIYHFEINEHNLLISKEELYNSYINIINTDKKYGRESFCKEVINVRRYFNKVEYDDKTYLQLDIKKISAQLKINRKKIMKLFNIIPIYQERKIKDYEKIKLIKEIIND